ncbi:MAG TPA: EAL domain-containing protein [Acidimicrobiales bacterium]|nr:EAL domain-containing protein [Acidimicrobiales bacterium]
MTPESLSGLLTSPGPVPRAGGRSPHHEPAPPRASRQTQPAPDPGPRHARVTTDVLLVGGSPEDARRLEGLLEQPGWEEGHFELRTTSPGEASAELRRRRPDAVLLDLTGGAADLEHLCRLMAGDPSLPFIVVTTQEHAPAGRDALMHGAHDFLVKESMTNEQVVRSLRYAIGRAATAAEAEATERRFRSLVSRITDVVTVVAPSGHVLYISPSAPRLLGLDSSTQLVERGIMGYIHEDDLPAAAEAWEAWVRGDPAVLECRVVGRGGRVSFCESVGTNLADDPAVGGIVITTRDISDRKRAQEHLSYQARHDSLTGLPNRAMVLDELAAGLAAPAGREAGVALLFVDIDHFKLINDHHGHRTGDDVLTEIGSLLAEAVRPGDVVGRLGGDEFAVICRGVTDRTAAISVAGRLVQAMSRPLFVRSRTFRVAVSVGIALSNATSTADGLLSEADVALHQAKEFGRGRVEVFDERLRARRSEELRLEEDLRFAAEDGQFRVHYQPLIEISTGRLTGFEALVRWQHPELGLLQPAAFIDIAERTYQISGIGEYVLGAACRQLATWNAAPDRSLTVAVNLSAQQLADPRLPQVLGTALHEASLDPSRLCLEITESVAMKDAEASVRALLALRALGVKLAIDDFGTGYSSLAYLRRLPVDHVKIDRSFVSGLGRDRVDRVVVDSIIHLADRLGLEVVAEGVETESQMSELLDLGCRYAQGFFWGRPVPAPEASDFLEAAAGGALGVPIAAERARQRAGMPPTPGAGHLEATAAMVARQMRHPARLIADATDTMTSHLESGRPDAAVATIETIRRQVARFETLADAVTDVPAVDEGTLELDVQPIELGELVDGVLSDLGPRLDGHPLVRDASVPVRALVDPVRTAQAVTYLLENAVAFSPDGAPIEVSITGTDREVVVRVVDQGLAAPADRIGWLFGKLTPVGSSGEADNAERSGLGLYLARGYARAHGGDIRFHRAKDAGAEFVLTLPAVPRPAPVPADASARAADALSPRRSSGSASSLVESRLRDDAEAMAAVLAASRALLRVEHPEDAVGVAIDLVHELGGHVMPARIAPEHALDSDLSCGEGEALVALAEPYSPSRLRLEYALPGFTEDMARVVGALRRMVRDGVAEGPSEATLDLLDALGPGSVVIALRPAAEPASARVAPAVVASLGRMVRTELRAGDVCARWSSNELVTALPGTSPEEAAAVLQRLRRRWSEWRPEAVALVAEVVPVGAEGGRSAARTAVAAAAQKAAGR